MNFSLTSDAVRQRLMEESGGSFHIVSRALNELATEKRSRKLSTQAVVDRIRQIMEQEQREKTPA